MNDLITVVGGSGFIGRYIVAELARGGHRVRVAARSPHKALFLKTMGQPGQIQLVAADLGRPATLAAAMAGASAAINLVGILAEGGGRSFDGIHARGAGASARAAAEAGAGAFVQVSAIGADARSPSAYGRSKAGGEAAVREAFPGATILRPSLVFGPEDGFINRFASLAKASPVMPVVAGGTRFQPVHVLDVARAAARAATDPAAFAGRTFELGGPTVYPFRDLIAWIMAEIRVDKPMIEVPDFAARLMARAGDIVPGAPMTSDQFAMLQRDNVVAEGAAGLAAFGITPTPLEAIAPGYLERYRRSGRFSRAPADADAG